jgi:peptidoglycan/LPS O-acetylase OafA/YrhL
MDKSTRFQELDALRGLAALWVIVYHYLTRFDEIYRPYGYSLTGGLLFPNGTYGVLLFFMISGFVIFMTLHHCRSPFDFIVSRFSRLYPAYWLSVGITAAVAYIVPLPGQLLSLKQVLVNLTMLQGFFYVGDVDGVYWSLMTELSFYFVMFVIFVVGMLRHTETICWFWLGTALISRLLAPFGWELPYRVGVLFVMEYAQFFIAGIVFYRVRAEGYTPNRLCLLIASFALAAFSDANHLQPSPVIVAAYFLMFHLCISNRMTHLRLPPLLWLGAISFPLYLTHQMIGYRVIEAMLDRGLPAQLVIPTTMAGAIALATAITLTVEQPGMRFIRQCYRSAASRLGQKAASARTAIEL